MLGVLGAMAGTDRPHADAFEIVRPGLDVEREQVRWAADDPDGLRTDFDADDLYTDVRSCLAALRDGGRRVVIAGNQPPQARAALEAMGLDVDEILISDELGVEKPDPAFFSAVVVACGVEPARIAYVGDRLDNDVIPAGRAGMRTVLLRRGPVGVPPRRATRGGASRHRHRLARRPAAAPRRAVLRRALVGSTVRRAHSSAG